MSDIRESQALTLKVFSESPAFLDVPPGFNHRLLGHDLIRPTSLVHFSMTRIAQIRTGARRMLIPIISAILPVRLSRTGTKTDTRLSRYNWTRLEAQQHKADSNFENIRVGNVYGRDIAPSWKTYEAFTKWGNRQHRLGKGLGQDSWEVSSSLPPRVVLAALAFGLDKTHELVRTLSPVLAMSWPCPGLAYPSSKLKNFNDLSIEFRPQKRAQLPFHSSPPQVRQVLLNIKPPSGSLAVTSLQSAICSGPSFIQAGAGLHSHVCVPFRARSTPHNPNLRIAAPNITGLKVSYLEDGLEIGQVHQSVFELSVEIINTLPEVNLQ
ncbi:hypothetical protein GALMADRAFT_208668 [Galerina marginata CBS 339.88]|uniref:Uncharacterized protein n=1 Tax=Galerina marginata (strain CBS 339.88) TaxID=685588 RepID=A0A067TH17_GALM3|nr:hypothetical protein GALMADRAFT_208668 [Galerina marginata CBS 339.88]